MSLTAPQRAMLLSLLKAPGHVRHVGGAEVNVCRALVRLDLARLRDDGGTELRDGERWTAGLTPDGVAMARVIGLVSIRTTLRQIAELGPLARAFYTSLDALAAAGLVDAHRASIGEPDEHVLYTVAK